MGHIENLKPAKPAEAGASESAQNLHKDAYKPTELPRVAAGGSLPAEFGTVTIEQQKRTHVDSELKISTTVSENHIQGMDDPLRKLCAQPLPKIDMPPGMKEAEKELKDRKGSDLDQVGLGVQIGTVKGVIGLGNGVIDLGNMALSAPMRAGDFLANTIKNPQLAMHDADTFGKDAANTIYGSIKAVATADKYMEDVSKAMWKGDFVKAPRDAMHLAATGADAFEQLPPGKKAEVLSEQGVTWGAPIAAGKISAGLLAGWKQKVAEFDAKSAAAAEKYTGAVEGIVEGDAPKRSESLERAKKQRLEEAIKDLPAKTAGFDAELNQSVNVIKSRLSDSELEVVDKLTIKGWDSVAKKHADGDQVHTLGTFMRGAKEVDISQWVKEGGSWQANRRLLGTLCHEFGHAVNVMTDQSFHRTPLTESEAFKTAFAKDWSRNRDHNMAELKQLFSRDRYYRKTDSGALIHNEFGQPIVDNVKVRDEVFAELFCRAKGFDASSNFAQKIRDLFPDTFKDVMEKQYGPRR